MNVCSIDGCNKPPRSRDLCSLHYRRWQRHGDPLAGRTPDGEPLRYFREVVMAYEGDDCLTWPFSRDSNGRGQMEYNGRQAKVSRLACEEANGPPPTPKHEAAHSCGNGHEACCTKRHLSWKTHAENEADKIVHGTHIHGERCWNSKLTESDVLAIRETSGTAKQVAKKFGVDRTTIWKIRHGVNWSHV